MSAAEVVAMQPASLRSIAREAVRRCAAGSLYDPATRADVTPAELDEAEAAVASQLADMLKKTGAREGGPDVRDVHDYAHQLSQYYLAEKRT